MAKTKFQINFLENLKRDSNLPSTKPISFNDLGDFQEERNKINRLLEKKLNTELKIDFSNFSSHVFFDSALEKFNASKKKIFAYPYFGSSEEKEEYALSSSGYENDLLENRWPKFIGYASFNGTNQYISASDYDGKLFLGSSSLYISSWINPVILTQSVILQAISSSVSTGNKFGYEFILSGNTDPHLKFSLYSGSSIARVSSSYTSFTGSFHNVSIIYDRPTGFLSLYVDATKKASSSLNFKPIEFNSVKVYIGSGSSFSGAYSFYSGSIDEIRIMHTSSELFHFKNYSRVINSEDILKLKYSFNEGITTLSNVDSLVVDYSKSGIHGKIVNYTSDFRVSGSAITKELGSPILYGFHPLVTAFTSSIQQSASSYDDNNSNLIFNYIPEDVLRDDTKQSGLMYYFSLGLARYFDEIKTYIDQFENIKTTNYDNVNETPDLFLPYLKKYFGWKVTEHFSEANPLEFFFGENILPSGSLDLPLYEVRNEFWRRILNNLPYLYATKGKRNNIDSLFNVLGLNRENINLKEYGYLPGGSLIEETIHKEKAVSVLGITGSLSSSYVKIPLPIPGALDKYTVESYVQFPWNSSSFTSSLTQGSIWQFASGTTAQGGFSLLWQKDTLISRTGKLILTGTDGQQLTGANLTLFDGDWLYIAAGRNADNKAFIELRTIDNDRIDFSASFVSSLALSGVFTGSAYDFIIGANSGSNQRNFTKGYFSQFRLWNRALSSSEINTHAMHFENVGTYNPLENPNPLVGHWPLNDNLSASSAGTLISINDYSRLGKIATGSNFTPFNNPFKKALLEYNYISPSIDLKWTENKIRIRNKTFLKKSEIATDTNEVALEFNFIDALNEDIMKIFSSFNVLHNVIGNPINKYRAEYDDLESLRRVYFARLGDSINFNSFFNLFKWFDKKISDSIKQLLPARVKFIGGEHVVESHFLERPKYQYKYPIFKTPVDIPEINFSSSGNLTGNNMFTFTNDLTFASPHVISVIEKEKLHNFIKRNSSNLRVVEVSPKESLVIIICELLKS